MCTDARLPEPAGWTGQRGLGLLQVLIAILILAIGLIGLAGLQAASLLANRGAHHVTQANLLAYDILDRMRANRQAAVDGHYNGDRHSVTDAAARRASADVRTWRQLLRQQLPQENESGDPVGGGTVVVDGDGHVSVTISWFDPRSPVAPHDGEPVRRITLTTRL